MEHISLADENEKLQSDLKKEQKHLNDTKKALGAVYVLLCQIVYGMLYEMHIRGFRCQPLRLLQSDWAELGLRFSLILGLQVKVTICKHILLKGNGDKTGIHSTCCV